MLCYILDQDVSTDKALLQAIVLTLVCWILVFALAAIVGVMISLFGQPMFWFTRTYNIILVFGVLSFTTMLGFHYLLKTHLYKVCMITIYMGPPWSWSYGSWIYNSDGWQFLRLVLFCSGDWLNHQNRKKLISKMKKWEAIDRA
jgi:hypothetical protein